MYYQNEDAKPERFTTEIPSKYVAVDLETTGFDPQLDSIIEVAAVRVDKGLIQDKFQCLIKIEKPVPEGIRELTGISDAMLKDGLPLKNTLLSLINFIDYDPIAAHNAQFEQKFLCHYFRDQIDLELDNQFIDTLDLARVTFPGMISHTLESLTDLIGIPVDTHHRAMADAVQTVQLLEFIRSFQCLHNSYIDGKKGSKRKKHYMASIYGVGANDICPQCDQFSPDSLFLESTCVITGSLNFMTRAEALQTIVDLGGKVANAITRKTTFLIVGDTDSLEMVKDGKTSKLKKAEEYIEKGCQIRILTEDEFLEMIEKSRIKETAHE